MPMILCISLGGENIPVQNGVAFSKMHRVIE